MRDYLKSETKIPKKISIVVSEISSANLSKQLTKQVRKSLIDLLARETKLSDFSRKAGKLFD